MTLGSTQPLTEMGTRNLPGGEGRPASKADNLTAIYEPNIYKMWEPRPLTTLWTARPVTRISIFTFIFYLARVLWPRWTMFLTRYSERQTNGSTSFIACLISQCRKKAHYWIVYSPNSEQTCKRFNTLSLQIRFYKLTKYFLHIRIFKKPLNNRSFSKYSYSARFSKK
jgi:hypothetical protein